MKTLEKLLHDTFKKHNIRNEWFRLTSEISAYIEAHAESGKDILADGYQRELERNKQKRPEVKERRREYRQHPEVKERRREYRQRPEVKERTREYKKEYRQRPEVKEAERKRRQTPEYKEYQRQYRLKKERQRKSNQLELFPVNEN